MLKEHFLDRFHRNERVITLSDGVFSIVMTLLVLELRIPKMAPDISTADMWHALVEIKAKLIGFLLSFLFVASLWFSHNQLFKLFDKVDNTMLWFNIFLLLVVCFIPFPTALIGEYPENPVGIFLFGGIWVVIPLIIYLIGSRAYHKKYLHYSVDIKRYKFLRKMAILFAPLSAIPMFFCWAMPKAAISFYLVQMLVSIIAGFTVKVIEE
jgi:uncharacterized membrane protein